MSFELLLNTPRALPFPYPLCRAGSTRDTCRLNNDVCFRDRLEVCLRLSSPEEFAIDEIDGNTYRTAFPHIIFKHPFHRLRFSYSQPRNTVHFSYALDTAREMLAAGLLPPAGQYHLPLKLTEEIQLLIRKFTDLLNHTLERKMLDRLDLVAFELLAECLLEQRFPEPGPRRSVDAILAIASRLRQEFRNEPDFETLARSHGMSLRTFFRHWSESFAQSPNQFVQELKIREAERLLRETSLPVSAIAAFVGLGDASYFSKVFRKWYQLSPGEYRSAEAAKALLEHIGPPPTDDARVW